MQKTSMILFALVLVSSIQSASQCMNAKNCSSRRRLASKTFQHCAKETKVPTKEFNSSECNGWKYELPPSQECMSAINESGSLKQRSKWMPNLLRCMGFPGRRLAAKNFQDCAKEIKIPESSYLKNPILYKCNGWKHREQPSTTCMLAIGPRGQGQE